METVIELLEEKARKYPNAKIKIVKVEDEGENQGEKKLSFSEEMTFKEWSEKSSKLANFLIDIGVKKGDKVCILMSNDDGIFYKIAYFGIAKAGALPVPVNIRLPDEGVKFIVENSDAKGIIYGDKFESRVKGLGVKAFGNQEVRRRRKWRIIQQSFQMSR